MEHRVRGARESEGGLKGLVVWHRAMELMVESYQVAAALPTEERAGLTDQIRRAAVSVPANIAEGHGHQHLGDYLRYLSVASGSLAELHTLLLATERLSYRSPTQLLRPLALATETTRMLMALTTAIRRRKDGERRPSPLNPSS